MWANTVQKSLQIPWGKFYKSALKFLYRIFFLSYPVFYLYNILVQNSSPRQYFWLLKEILPSVQKEKSFKHMESPFLHKQTKKPLIEKKKKKALKI